MTIKRQREMYDVKNLEAFLAEVAEGSVPGAFARNVQGYRSVLTSSLEDLSELTPTIIPIPASAIAMEIDSSSVNDAAAGTGAQQVEVHGLDANYVEISELITTNGTTAVATVNSYIRINNFHVMQVGSGGVAAGDITLQSVGGATIYNKIAAGGNMCLQSHITIPANKTGFIHKIAMGAVTVNTNTSARILLRAKADWHDRSLITPYNFEKITAFQDGSLEQFVGHWYPSQCDIKVSGQLTSGAVATIGTCNFNVYIFNQET